MRPGKNMGGSSENEREDNPEYQGGESGPNFGWWAAGIVLAGITLHAVPTLVWVFVGSLLLVAMYPLFKGTVKKMWHLGIVPKIDNFLARLLHYEVPITVVTIVAEKASVVTDENAVVLHEGDDDEALLDQYMFKARRGGFRGMEGFCTGDFYHTPYRNTFIERLDFDQLVEEEDACEAELSRVMREFNSTMPKVQDNVQRALSYKTDMARNQLKDRLESVQAYINRRKEADHARVESALTSV